MPFLGAPAPSQPRRVARVGRILDRVLRRPGSRVVARRRRARRARHPGARACTPPTRASRACRAASPSCRPTTASRPRSRADRCPRSSSSRPTTSRAPEVQAGIAELGAGAARRTRRREPVTTDVSPNKTVAGRHDPAAPATAPTTRSDAALAKLRDDVDAAARSASVHGVEADVTGMTAGSKDFNDAMKAHLPIVFAFVLGLAFLLLLVTFRSIVDPDQGDRAQPAVGRRRLRRAHAGLPGRPRREPARLPVHRRRSRRGCRCSCS